MKPYYIATAVADDASHWMYMFHTQAQADSFVRAAYLSKLPEHQSYVGLRWDVVPMMVQSTNEALREFLAI